MDFDRFQILLETARNRQELPEMLRISKSDRFCGISWYRWISIVFSNSARNCQKSSEVARNLETWSISVGIYFLIKSITYFSSEIPDILRFLIWGKNEASVSRRLHPPWVEYRILTIKQTKHYRSTKIINNASIFHTGRGTQLSQHLNGVLTVGPDYHR